MCIECWENSFLKAKEKIILNESIVVSTRPVFNQAVAMLMAANAPDHITYIIRKTMFANHPPKRACILRPICAKIILYSSGAFFWTFLFGGFVYDAPCQPLIAFSSFAA